MRNIVEVTMEEAEAVVRALGVSKKVSDFESYDQYYAYNLRRGDIFQDYVLRALQKVGMCFIPFSSQFYQYEVGENTGCMETKLDSLMAVKGNIYVETGEKKPWRDTYVPSGIFREDNSIFYAIGNPNTIFVMAKKDLIHHYHLNQAQSMYRVITNKTSTGFLMPVSIATEVALLIIKVANLSD